MRDPLLGRALARIRHLLHALHRHEVAPENVTLVTVADIILAIEAPCFREPLVTHSVPGAGPDAAWALSWPDGYSVLGLLVPPVTKLDTSEAIGAIPVLVIEGSRAELTFVALDDIEVRS